jgi:hypothetical protein
MDVRTNSENVQLNVDKKLMLAAGPSALDFPELLPTLPPVLLTKNA